MANLLFTFLASSAKITNVAAKPFGVLAAFDVSLRKWLSGRASPCQGEGREFESRLPLQNFVSRQYLQDCRYCRFLFFSFPFDCYFLAGPYLIGFAR